VISCRSFSKNGLFVKADSAMTARQLFRADASPLSAGVLGENYVFARQVFDASDSLRLCRRVRTTQWI